MELTPTELTYLELTAKHSPSELPSSATLVERLVKYVSEGLSQEELGEYLQSQLEEKDEIVTRLEEENANLKHEIEDLKEQLAAAEDALSVLDA